MLLPNQNHPKRGSSIKVEPIRTISAIRRIRRLLRDRPRDRCLFDLGINTAFRASDLLSMRVSDVVGLRPGQELELKERKTGKYRRVTINRAAVTAVREWLKVSGLDLDDHLFMGQRGCLTVPTVSRMVKSWCHCTGLEGNYAAHTLRKTWGLMMRTRYKIPLPVLMMAYGHSSQRQTLAYLCIQEREIKRLYLNEL